jgi:hypothetical protein
MPARTSCVAGSEAATEFKGIFPLPLHNAAEGETAVSALVRVSRALIMGQIPFAGPDPTCSGGF